MNKAHLLIAIPCLCSIAQAAATQQDDWSYQRLNVVMQLATADALLAGAPRSELGKIMLRHLERETSTRHSAGYAAFIKDYKAFLQLEKPERSQYKALMKKHRFWLTPCMNAYDALLIKVMRPGATKNTDEKKLLSKTVEALKLQLAVMDDEQAWQLSQQISQLSRSHLKPLRDAMSSSRAKPLRVSSTESDKQDEEQDEGQDEGQAQRARQEFRTRFSTLLQQLPEPMQASYVSASELVLHDIRGEEPSDLSALSEQQLAVYYMMVDAISAGLRDR